MENSAPDVKPNIKPDVTSNTKKNGMFFLAGALFTCMVLGIGVYLGSQYFNGGSFEGNASTEGIQYEVADVISDKESLVAGDTEGSEDIGELVESSVSTEAEVDVQEENILTEEELVATILASKTQEELMSGVWTKYGWPYYSMQRLLLREDGTGTATITNYCDETNIAMSNVKTGDSFELTWIMEGDIITTTTTAYTQTNEVVYLVDNFIYYPEEEKLVMTTEQFWDLAMYDPDDFFRYEPEIEEGFITVSEWNRRKNNQLQPLIDQIKGLWHLELLEWNYNEDGTGFILIPKIGAEPEEIREFTWTIDDLDSGYFLICKFNYGTESQAITYQWVEFSEDGKTMYCRGASDTEPVRYTRNFDLTNMEYTVEAFADMYSVFFGGPSNLIGGSISPGTVLDFVLDWFC